MPTMIEWRYGKPSEYNKLPTGVSYADYGLDEAKIPKAVKVEGLHRWLRHVYNNEAIASCLTAKANAEKAAVPFDSVQWLHDWRMARKSEIMDGTYGQSRRASESSVVDDLTREMQKIAHSKFYAIAVSQGRTDFPDEFTPQTSKVKIKGETTLGMLIAAMLSGPTATAIREEAQKKLDEEKAARLAAAQSPDDEAAKLLAEMMAA